ncbi:MAG: amidase [Syntrophaceae bacterium]|jgi:aspartyl-tRNA(Asn)/glutamyl-tRNA(Gln) amidotransferase subunit A|nr:amidase [Syntrophaceae bacterium]
MTEPYRLTLSEMVRQIGRKKLSPVDLAESLLNRIDLLEPSIQAWVTIERQKVLEEARRCAKEISRGRIRGPLHGVPLGVKDIFYTAGIKTGGGSKVLADFTPSFDSTAVHRLKQAGAIVLGKTATTEFAHADPAPTCNPWNREHTPGGSSSGSAAAVASGMCPGALGSQTGGSVLRPAAYCGVVGLKPTYGRVSRYGVIPFSWSLDHVGVLTRTAADAALLLSVLAGFDPRDPTSGRQEVPQYTRFRKSTRSPIIGVVEEFYRKNAEAQVWENTWAVLKRLKKAGARVEEVKMPESFAVVHDAHRVLMRAEGAAFHRPLFQKHADLYRPKLRELIELGGLIPAVDYLSAYRIKREFRRHMDRVMERYDLLLTPTTSSPAPRGLDSTGDPWFQVPWSFCGLPTITLPSGLSQDGLPLGVQLAGRAYSEGELLAWARWCEKVLEVSLTSPLD